MLISSVRDNERTVERDGKRQRQKTQRGDESCSESVRPEWFFCAFKLGLLQLIWKAS